MLVFFRSYINDKSAFLSNSFFAMVADAYNIYQTVEILSTNGYKKANQRIDHMLIKSFLAGVLLSFGGLFLLTVGGGSAPLAQNFGPGVQKMLQASVFPIGLILIILTSADLFTGNTMILMISTLHKKTSWLNLLLTWSISYIGNFLGCLFFQFILVYYAGLLESEPYRSYSIKYAEYKGYTEWYQLFLRAISGNWLVCLGVLLGVSARDLSSKIIGVYLPIWLFVAVGFEHSIANMFTVQMGMILGANVSILRYILNVLIPVTIGNIIGGGVFVGFVYWYLYLAKKVDNTTAEIPMNQTYRPVNQQENIVSS